MEIKDNRHLFANRKRENDKKDYPAQDVDEKIRLAEDFVASQLLGKSVRIEGTLYRVTEIPWLSLQTNRAVVYVHGRNRAAEISLNTEFIAAALQRATDNAAKEEPEDLTKLPEFLMLLALRRRRSEGAGNVVSGAPGEVVQMPSGAEYRLDRTGFRRLNKKSKGGRKQSRGKAK